MAAGLGFKTFTTGEVLTAADTNGYLMQGILVFASEAARDAAITSPQEGQFAYTKDNDSLWYYSASAWVASGATGDIEGVTAGVGISGGGTSGTVTITNSMATAIDAKADLVVGTGADTFSVLAVGANDTVLTADSSEATGLKWAAAASGGGMTLLSTTTATADTTITLSSISQDYIHLQIILDNITVSSDAVIRMRFNGDTNTRYRNLLDPLDFNNTFNSDFMRASGTFSSSVAESCSIVDIPRYTNTYSRKYAQENFFGVNNSTTTNGQVEGFGNLYNQTPAITSITLYPATGTFSGTILLYGVK